MAVQTAPCRALVPSTFPAHTRTQRVVEVKSGDTLDKVLASHQFYKRPLMLLWDGSGRLMTIRQDANGKTVGNQVVRIDLMTNL